MSAEGGDTLTPDRDQTSSQSQLRSLKNRIKELEAENAKLVSQLSNCCCSQRAEKLELDICNKSAGVNRKLKSVDNNSIKKNVADRSPDYMRIMGHHARRYIALKVMYFGRRFYGFASEAQMEPTVESEIFRALEKARLLVGDKKESHYSRCGRTDKGVSSVGQVISLFLRSNLKEVEAYDENGHQYSKKQYEEEIDYVRVLNRVLPNDIRVMGWCPIPDGFSARFSCLSREYKYFFWKEHLNIQAMETAATKFVGEHDFRNFCKMDAVNVHNYQRQILSFDISPYDVRFEVNQLWAFQIKGSAFLWHQVRCMVAVLFMIGRGLEFPDVIDVLLDTSSTPRKPQYLMASEIPLVLQSCEFEGLKFKCSSVARQALCDHFASESKDYQLQAAIYHEALLSCNPILNDGSSLYNRTTVKKASHVPLLSRPTEPSYEERGAKLNRP